MDELKNLIIEKIKTSANGISMTSNHEVDKNIASAIENLCMSLLILNNIKED